MMIITREQAEKVLETIQVENFYNVVALCIEDETCEINAYIEERGEATETGCMIELYEATFCNVKKGMFRKTLGEGFYEILDEVMPKIYVHAINEAKEIISNISEDKYILCYDEESLEVIKHLENGEYIILNTYTDKLYNQIAEDIQ